MPKVVREPQEKAEITGEERFYFWCPGCYERYKLLLPEEPQYWMHGALHCFAVPPWTFNMDFDKPTIRASVLVTYGTGDHKSSARCHSFVTDGRIQFLDDCTHPLKGQTVDLMDCPEDY